MKILVIGLGSIGQRHLQNLKKIYSKANFFALRFSNKNLIIKNAQVVKKYNIAKYYNIKILRSYKDAKKIKPNLVFICNPSCFHLRDAKFFSKLGSHIFIEKPLSGDNIQISKLKNIISKKKIHSMIGFQLRFHPIINFVKKVITNNKFGKIVRANINNLSYLPNFHPYENYSKSYAAQKKLGGGVLTTLIHEVDLIAYFFGLPKKIHVHKYNSKILRCNVDDNIFCFMSYIKNKNPFTVSLNLSFTHPKPKRDFSILFKDVFIQCDLIKNEIKIISNKNKKTIYYKKFLFNRNKLFLDEIKYFKSCINKNKANFLSVKNTMDTTFLYNRIST